MADEEGAGGLGGPGVMSSYNADQALLVAWGGVNSTARSELRNQFFQIRVWDAEAFMDELLDVYENLDEEIRNELRLKPIWIADQED